MLLIHIFSQLVPVIKHSTKIFLNMYGIAPEYFLSLTRMNFGRYEQILTVQGKVQSRSLNL